MGKYMKFFRSFLVLMIGGLFLVGCGPDNYTTNVPPQAIAGENILINLEDNATLDATKSIDTDGQIVSYEWQNDKNQTISRKKIYNLSGLSLGKHVYKLIVTDNNTATASDTITVTVTKNKMSLKDNVVVLENNTEEKIVSITGKLGKDGNMTFKNPDDVKNWKIGEVKILQPSTTIPQGMAFKIKSKKTNTRGESKIEYVVPTIDEVFKDSKVEVKSVLTSNMITKINMNKYAKISFEQKNKTTQKLEKWFPKPPSLTPTINGTSGNLIDKIKVELDVPIYENNESNKVREFANLKAGFELTDFSLDYLFENHVIDNVASLKKPTMINKLDLKYNITKTVDLEISASFKASLAEKMKDSMFECGLKANLADNNYVNIKLESSGFDQSDICLGSVSLELSPAVVKASAGNMKTEAPAALKLFFIMGADLNIKVVSKISLEHKSYIHAGAYFDTTKDLNKVFDAYYTEQVSSSDASQPKWTSNISGEMSGDATFYQGIAFTPQIMNMYPFVLSTKAGPKMDGKLTASFSSDKNKDSGFCADVDLKIDYGFYARTSNKFDINVTNTKIRRWITKGFDTSFNYEWKTDFDALDLYSYNSCQDDDYTLEFKFLPVESKDFSLSNIQVLDKDKNIINPDSVRYVIYKDGIFVISGSSVDIFNTLSYGNYVIEAIVDIDSKNAIKSTLQTNYRVNTPPIADIGDDREALLGSTISIDASNSYDSDGKIILYTFSVDGAVKQKDKNSIFPLTFNTLGEHNITLETTDNDGAISEDSITLTVTEINTPPKANAGADQIIKKGATVTLDASGSTDDNKDSLTYKWTWKSDVDDSTLEKDDESFEVAGLSVGEHTFTLTVTDSDGEVDSDEVVVTVVEKVSLSTSKLKKTGQTKSYDQSGNEVTDGSQKDDGYYQKGATPSYTRDDSKEVVTDNLTGLMWQDDEASKLSTKPWLTSTNYNTCSNDTSSSACYDTSGDTATTYCSNLTLGGYTDWRLPTVSELDRIVNYGKDNLFIDTTYFNVSSDGYYWSSTIFKGDKKYAWYVNFFNSTLQPSVDYQTKDINFHVRCVRGGEH